MKRLLLAVLCLACADGDRGTSAIECSEPRRIAALPAEIDEASGLAISRRHPGILWLHNDSGDPILYAIDTLGNLRARVRVPVKRNADWEDLAVAPCGSRTCLFIGAIGDNQQDRADRAVLRVPEPALTDSVTRPPVVLPVRLPSGPRDAEALFVANGAIHIITKGRRGAVDVYRMRENGELDSLQSLSAGIVQLPDMITAASATPDGRFVVVRSYSALQVYDRPDGRLSPLLPGAGLPLASIAEPQGEAADITAAGTIYLASEKGLHDEAPPLSVVTCRLPR